MRKRDALFVLTVMILSAWAGFGTLWSGALLAADNKCITEPNLQSPQDSHWYYHTDSVSHRKCWYVGRLGMKVHPPPESRPSQKPKSDSRVTKNVRVNNGEISHQFDARLNETARDALFQEFLRWQERQNRGDPSLNQANRDALFREFLLWEERQANQSVER